MLHLVEEPARAIKLQGTRGWESLSTEGRTEPGPREQQGFPKMIGKKEIMVEFPA